MHDPAELVAYSDLQHDPLVVALAEGHSGDAGARTRVARVLFDEPWGPAAALAQRVISSTGPFARASRAGIADQAKTQVAERELDWLQGLLPAGDTGGSATGRQGDSPAAGGMRAALADAVRWGELARDLVRFHAENGVGHLATHRVLRFGKNGLVGVDRPDPTQVDDLVGQEELRRPLAEALAAFARGRSAVDALLYGPPGTGKSVTVRALAASHAHQGLRLILVLRESVADLGRLFDAVAGQRPRVLVLMDDLVFDEAGRGDRALRAALEGDVAERPENVAVWATSNRMRLIHETHHDRESDVEEALGRGERAALATRFALRVHVPQLGLEEFARMALLLVERRGGDASGLRQEAVRYARDHGLTARSAQHFAALTDAVTATPSRG